MAAVDAFFVPLRHLVESLVRILRWRGGDATAPLYPFLNIEEYLSTDGVTWIQVPTLRGLEIRQGIGLTELTVTAEVNEEIKALLIGNFEEPLGHQLFREAWNLRVTNPRSALVIGVAAAEVGVKKLIGALVPNARWLVEEIQSPPLAKLLRKYLPTLPMKSRFFGNVTGFPAKLTKTIDLAVERRNKTVHAGEPPPEQDELEKILRAVNDLLWICDCYLGNTWAAAYISDETGQAWTQELKK